MKHVICFFKVLMGLILARELPVKDFSPESTMGIAPGIYWMNAFKYLMSSVLSAGETANALRAS